MKFGLEIDIRDYNGILVLSHDLPNEKCLSFEKFLESVNPNTMLLINVKSTDIQQNLQEILTKYKIENYFTFDWAVPDLLKAVKNNLICAFRVSEYEKEIIPGCTWVWVDSFHSIWYDEKYLKNLKTAGLKIALVSPELHNRDSELERIRKIIKNIDVDVICTDIPEFWVK